MKLGKEELFPDFHKFKHLEDQRSPVPLHGSNNGLNTLRGYHKGAEGGFPS